MKQRLLFPILVVVYLWFFVIGYAAKASGSSGCPWLAGKAAKPGNSSRFITCPVEESRPEGLTWMGRPVKYKGDEAVNFSSRNWPKEVSARWNGLSEIPLPKSRRLYAVVIDIRVVKGKPVYFYLSNNTQDVVFQPWSSSKFIAAMSAISMVRAASYGSIGANATVNNIHVGDLITSIHAYRRTGRAPANSNGIAQWFQDVAGRQNSTRLIRQWLNRPKGETFGGGYGVDWSPGSFRFTDGAGRSVKVANFGRWMPNQLSNLTIAEILKRLATHSYLSRKYAPGVAFPNIKDEDVEILFYGNPNRAGPGGMLATRNPYLRNALGGTDNLNKRTGGRWRIFQKTGSGPNRGGEFVLTAYACLPRFDGGRQFVISMFINDSDSSARDRCLMQESFTRITRALVPGFVKK